RIVKSEVGVQRVVIQAGVRIRDIPDICINQGVDIADYFLGVKNDIITGVYLAIRIALDINELFFSLDKKLEVGRVYLVKIKIICKYAVINAVKSFFRDRDLKILL